MQNAMSVEKLKCQRYLSRVKPGSFLAEHSHPLQFIGHVASTYVLHHEEEMFLQACVNIKHVAPTVSKQKTYYIHDEGKKFNTNHSIFSKDCPKMRKMESIIISKTEY